MTMAISPRQLRAVQAIAESASISAAADQCGTNRATLHRWLRLPEFREALDEIQRDQRARESRSSNAKRRLAKRSRSSKTTARSATRSDELDDSPVMSRAVFMRGNKIR